MLPISRCNTAGFRLILGMALLLVTWLMAMPQPASPEEFNDKIAHGLTFFVLAFLTDAAWPELSYNWRKVLPLGAYAIATEVMQHYLPVRTFEFTDILADWSGLAFYALVPVLVYRSRQSTGINDEP